MFHGTKIYKVTVSGGEIDNHKTSDYQEFYDDETYSTASDDADAYKEKAKAGERFKKVCLALQKGLDQMYDVETTGDDPKTVASSIEFKLVYTQHDGLWVEVDESEYSEDDEIEQLRDGRVIFKGSKAIERLIENACGETIAIVNYYDPRVSQTSNEVPSGSSSSPYRATTLPVGWSWEQMTIEETTPSITIEDITTIESQISLI